jgi:redox-sensing transcriptional repressor
MSGRRETPQGRERQERGFGRPLRKRLATYHQMAQQAAESGLAHVASAQLADLLGIDDSLVRKDMAQAGIAGRPKVGYPLAEVLRRLEELLGLSARNDAILIGCGHLGSAILGYPGFATYGLKITAAFDRDFAKVGLEIAGHRVLPMEKCRSILEIFQVKIAILTVPAAAAQELCDWLVSRGVRAIWNFSPTQLSVPAGVVVRNENLAVGLARLIHSLKEETERQSPLAVAR